ncbi:MAG: hypothetical protein K6G30_02095 [Acetatifactor sp.]|nr:hypothetical protein [Acetatifactor sp.]
MKHGMMKKIGALILAAAIGLSIPVNAQAAENEYPYLYVHGQVSEDDFDAFTKKLDVLKDNCPGILDAFEEDSWMIILTSDDLDELVFRGNTEDVYGCTLVKKKVIFIEAGENSGCIIHEMGHFLDSKSGMISKKKDFKAIYKQEKKNISEYGQTSASEFFAEVFKESVLNEDSISESCPKAFEFIDELKTQF